MTSRSTHTFECSCVGNCIVVRFDKWTDVPEFYAEMFVVPRPWGWRARLRHAWFALTGRYPNTPTPVIEAAEAKRLGEWLLEQVNEEAA